MIAYPSIDPILVSIGPFGPVGPLAIRWYGLMYVIGFAVGWWLGRRRASQPGSSWTAADVDDAVFFAAVGVILGGRLGWILFYSTKEVLADPLMILRIWEGGMSFHGGLLGALLAVAIFAARRRRHIGDVFDFMAPLPGLGILAGRIGNFINGELWGKPTEAPWGFLVNGEVLHASQLYEAALEGLVLFTVVWVFTSRPRPRWAASGLLLLLYGVFRFAVEFVRVPDGNMGYLAFGWVTTGQLLSLPMVAAGLGLLWFAYSRRQRSGNYA